jgi:glycosyltransferase involved in cell wall biosynthesis
MNGGTKWIVCHLGGRERYAIPRALRKKGLLLELITDFWFPPGLPHPHLLRQKVLSRWKPELSGAAVRSYNGFFLAFELMARLRGLRDWDLMIARNRAFQHHAAKRLGSLPKGEAGDGRDTVVFSYSYSALEQFREAKRRGWRTVLGQIDLGPLEDELEKRLLGEHPEWACSTPSSPPPSYWQDWHEECNLADTIIVNSEWAREGVIRQGISRDKLVVIPLAYEGRGKDPEVGRMDEEETHSLGSSASQPFSKENPLRILFLGQLVARKGIYDLIDSARMLEPDPVIIDVVGPHRPLPHGLPSNLRFHGAVALSETSAWYRRADLFVLPTHSDGFAITQLEAMSHGLPVITTPCCGSVVEDGWNGVLFPPGDSVALAGILRRLSSDRDLLHTMGRRATETVGRFSLAKLAESLAALS